MARSCAPVRDEEVAKLSEIDDVVDTFRGILETMTLMKLDMANCLLEAARKDVIAHSVEYEKQKFKEFMAVYTGMMRRPINLIQIYYNKFFRRFSEH